MVYLCVCVADWDVPGRVESREDRADRGEVSVQGGDPGGEETDSFLSH